MKIDEKTLRLAIRYALEQFKDGVYTYAQLENRLVTILKGQLRESERRNGLYPFLRIERIDPLNESAAEQMAIEKEKEDLAF